MAWRRLLLAGALGAAALDVPPAFDVRLGAAPAERWSGALRAVLDRHPWEHSFGPVFAHYDASLFSRLTPKHFALLGLAVKVHFPETAGELAGLARQFAEEGHPEVGFEYLAAWLYFHELAHTGVSLPGGVEPRECTGILANAADGSVLHAANMDQAPLQVRNLTIRVRFLDAANRTVFEGVDWYTLLSTGVSRAVRRGCVSLQENWRHAPPRPVAEVAADIVAGVVSQMLVFRRLLTRAHEDPVACAFPAVLEELSSVQLAAPYYIVVGGPAQGQAAVITRGLHSAENVTVLRPAAALAAGDDYFLAQSNYDRWLPDDAADPRRTAAELTLRRLGAGEGATQLGLMAVASEYPVHNPHTAYTALMSAATGELHAFVREASCPLDVDATVVPEGRYCRPAPPPGAPAIALV